VRRFSKAVVGAAGALLLASLAVTAQASAATGQAGAAGATTGKLLVTTIARDGQSVHTQVTAVLTSQTAGPSFGYSGQAFAVPDGQYAVMAGIGDSTSGTLAGAIVTVSGTGTTKVTLDGRQGKPVNVTLNGKQVTGSGEGQICALGGFASASVGAASNQLYVVPNSSKYLNFSYLAEGSGAILSGQTSSGVPAGLTAHWSTSQLVKVNAAVRSGEQPGSTTDYYIQGGDQPGVGITCQTFLYGSIDSGMPAPYLSTELVSPGYWVVEASSDGGFYYMPQHFVAGHSYHFTMYGAVWAPSGYLGSVNNKSFLFSLPTLTDAGGNGQQASLMNTLALSLNGHTVASGTMTDYASTSWGFSAAIKSAGWYTLTDQATRYHPGISFPSTILSPEVDLSWRFYASPSQNVAAEGFWTSFIPAGTNLANQAAPGSTTTIAVKPYRGPANPGSPIPSEAVSKVQAWWSSDGVHWHALTVSHSTTGWSVQVHNPASGYVSLRAEVTGSRGDTSVETVHKAYAIS
jgi:hypothetical protein